MSNETMTDKKSMQRASALLL